MGPCTKDQCLMRHSHNYIYLLICTVRATFEVESWSWSCNRPRAGHRARARHRARSSLQATPIGVELLFPLQSESKFAGKLAIACNTTKTYAQHQLWMVNLMYAAQNGCTLFCVEEYGGHWRDWQHQHVGRLHHHALTWHLDVQYNMGVTAPLFIDNRICVYI